MGGPSVLGSDSPVVGWWIAVKAGSVVDHWTVGCSSCCSLRVVAGLIQVLGARMIQLVVGNIHVSDIHAVVGIIHLAVVGRIRVAVVGRIQEVVVGIQEVVGGIQLVLGYVVCCP